MLSRLRSAQLRPLALMNPCALSPSSSSSSSIAPSMRHSSSPPPLSTHPKRPLPDHIAPATKRLRTEQDVPQPAGGGQAGAEGDDWFKGMVYPRVSKVDNADAVDQAPPLLELERLLAAQRASPPAPSSDKGASVVYWMNMEDMRLRDNRALHAAGVKAQELSLPLVVVFAVNPGDYRAHDRSRRRIDFMLRNLAVLKEELKELHIPLFTLVNPGARMALPARLLALFASPPVNAKHVFANLSYEVDELRRDIKVLELGQERGIRVEFEHDRVVVPPGGVAKKSKDGGVYTVYSPWFRAWSALINASPSKYLLELPPPFPNSPVAYKRLTAADEVKGLLEVPKEVEGFELESEDGERMGVLYPPGEAKAMEILERFVTTQPRTSQIGSSSPLADGAAEGQGKGAQASRLDGYAEGRNRADRDTTSRLSPYLTSGVLSPRQVLNRVKRHKGTKDLPVERKDDVGMWVGEVAWRDFYNHILAAFPRVSMGQPYSAKFRGIQWETDPVTFQAWKDGRTGFPIVDAAMRQCASQGWMHNRARMIAASFLVKDLMLDWRLGERHFMSMFIDGDLAANDGGWQWVAGTGTDPAPYFRIFSPVSQSQKADPSGDYIRFFVPELRGLKGKELYEPHQHLSPQAFAQLNYPKPIVDHAKARLRALARFKHVGDKPDEADGIDPSSLDAPPPKASRKGNNGKAGAGAKAKGSATLDGFVSRE